MRQLLSTPGSCSWKSDHRIGVFFLVCLLLAGFHVESNHAAPPEYMPNIGYLGAGYDVVFGNPHATLHDPGFRAPVIDMNAYTQNNTTPDKRFRLPDGTTARQEVACNYEADSASVFGASSYYDSLSEDAKISGGGWGFSFSASVDYQSVKKYTSSQRTAFVEAKARCSLYQAFLQNYENLTLTDNFRKGVASLPITSNNSDAYIFFIKNFGTHFTMMVDMGAKCVLRSEFTELAYSSMMSSNLDVSAAASASFLGFAGGVSSETKKQQAMAHQFESARSTVTQSFLGSRPSQDGNWKTWAETAGQTPYPFAYELLNIQRLFTSDFFPNEPHIVSKQRLLNEVMGVYCSKQEHCSVPGPDPFPVKYSITTNHEIQVGTVQCAPNHTAISCGIFNNVGNGDHAWRSMPFTNSSCECKDDNSDLCYAACVGSESVSGFSTVQQYGDINNTIANCPEGSTVLGCGLRLWTSGQDWEKWPYAFPFVHPDSTSGCECYGYFGATCTATCATNVANHVIKTNQSSGNVTVSCPENLFVLGCGFMPDGQQQYEVKPGYFMSSMTSCTCYNHFGVTCYASCGTFV